MSERYLLIEQESGLALLQSALADREACAIDTEFVREQTYFPKLALLQIESRGRVFLVDPVVLRLQAVAEVLRAQSQLMLYSAGEDLGVLDHALRYRPERMIDLQVAGAFLGYGMSLGLRDALKRELGLELDKSQTRSDWLKRPLSSAQLSYAALDVAHLRAISSRWLPLLQAQGKLAWFEDECARLRAKAFALADPQPHWNVRSHRELSHEAQLLLFRLLHWREHTARVSDRPRNWIAPNALLLALAERAPQDEAQTLAIVHQLQLPGSEKRARSLLEAMRNQHSEEKHFEPAPAFLAPAEKQRYNELRDTVNQLAQAQELPLELLAPRRLLEALARTATTGFPQEFQGWRQALIQPVLS